MRSEWFDFERLRKAMVPLTNMLRCTSSGSSCFHFPVPRTLSFPRLGRPRGRLPMVGMGASCWSLFLWDLLIQRCCAASQWAWSFRPRGPPFAFILFDPIPHDFNAATWRFVRACWAAPYCAAIASAKSASIGRAIQNRLKFELSTLGHNGCSLIPIRERKQGRACFSPYSGHVSAQILQNHIRQRASFNPHLRHSV